MKRLIIIFAFLQLLLLTGNAQDLTEKRTQLQQAGQTVVEFYQKGDLKDASEAAQKVLDLTIEIYGNDNRETAVAYNNLGKIFQARKKYDEAAGYFKKALRIYHLKPNENESKIADVLETLGVALTLDGKTDEAEKIIEDSIKTAENAFGSESREVLQYLKTGTSYYIYTKKYEKAENLFARQYIIALKVYGKDSEEKGKITNEFFCYLSNFKPEESAEKRKKFFDLTKDEDENAAKRADNSIDGGVVNGKAISLPQPVLPYFSNRLRPSGRITVSVFINEEGNVTEAKSICGGDKILQEASEKAAMKAKFKPTTVDGKPFKVIGTITYNYQ